jgi:photosystem II stability/assembly factor-like uncharacterized protein
MSSARPHLVLAATAIAGSLAFLAFSQAALAQPRITITGPTLAGLYDDTTYTATALGLGCAPGYTGWHWKFEGGQGFPLGNSLIMYWTSTGSNALSVTNSACGTAQGKTAVAVEDAFVDLFPDTPVGHSSTICGGVYFPGAPATNVEVSLPSPPFYFSGFNLEPGKSQVCTGGTAVEPPFTLPPGQGLFWTQTFSPTTPGTFMDSYFITPFGEIIYLRGATAIPRVVLGDEQGFDTCDAPKLAAMRDWRANSPYMDMNIYIGGVNRGCPNYGLTPAWVSSVLSQGWNLIPTWVGPQAPCTTSTDSLQFSSDPATARRQGAAEASAAVAAADELGLMPSGKSGTIIYYDMEAYGNDAGCQAAVESFLDGWVARLHATGNQAGAYGSSCASYISTWWTIAKRPDDIWAGDSTYSRYNAGATPWDLDCLDNDDWVNTQRIRQYAGDHWETYGKTRLRIDSDVCAGELVGYQPHPPADGNELKSVQLGPEVQAMGMLAPMVGWTLVGGRLLWTEDGGRSWLDRSPPLADQSAVRAVYFLDPSNGWAAAAVPLPNSGPRAAAGLELLATSDGGRSWREASIPALRSTARPSALWTVHMQFISARTGWLVTKEPTGSNFSLGRLFRTDDGGGTWTELQIPVGEAVRFLTPDLGWTAGGASGGKLYATRDGGRTWQRQAVTAEHSVFYDLPTFTSATDGVLPVTFHDSRPRVAFYVTHDSGQSWALAAEVPLQTAPTGTPPVSILDAQHWIVAAGDQLYVVAGEGAEPVSSVKETPGVAALAFADWSNGWAYVVRQGCTGTKGQRDFACTSRSALLHITDGEVEVPRDEGWP